MVSTFVVSDTKMGDGEDDLDYDDYNYNDTQEGYRVEER